MSQIDVPLAGAGFGQTRRADKWWVQPLFVFLGLSGFIVYSTWAALQGQHFRFGPYLSPFYSPELFGPLHESWFGQSPSWIPAWVTGAMLILWAPGGFRVTCYYYRGAYYKAFWAATYGMPSGLTASSGWESALWFCCSTWCCSPPTPSDATLFVIWSVVFET